MPQCCRDCACAPRSHVPGRSAGRRNRRARSLNCALPFEIELAFRPASQALFLTFEPASAGDTMFACIHIPDFPVEAIVRSGPLLRERSVAVLEGKPPL